jgi:hypothetical protein
MPPRSVHKQYAYFGTVGAGGADPVLYATKYSSKSHPILFAEQLRIHWDVRQSLNTWPELYLLFEIVS